MQELELHTAALGFGGGNPGPSYNRSIQNLWNGTNWTEVNDLNTMEETAIGGAGGTSTLAIGFGGNAPTSYTAATELWNGTNWTETLHDLGLLQDKDLEGPIGSIKYICFSS